MLGYSNVVCDPRGQPPWKTLQGCKFVVVDDDGRKGGHDSNVACLVNVKDLDEFSERTTDSTWVAGLVIPYTSSCAAVKRWKLKHPSKVLAVELQNKNEFTQFAQQLWSCAGNFIDLIWAPFPILPGDEDEGVPALPPYKLATMVRETSTYPSTKHNNSKTLVVLSESLVPKGNALESIRATSSVAPSRSRGLPAWAWALIGTFIALVISIGITILVKKAQSAPKRTKQPPRKPLE